MSMSPAANSDEVLILADGNAIPLLALGVWEITDEDECAAAVRSSLELGYRHIDTAQGYENEPSVGRGIRESGVTREDIFVTTKWYPGGDDPAQELEKSLKRLQLDYVDLYLVHWPLGGPTRAWPSMEIAHERGHARSIGISNFSVAEMEAVTAGANVQPVANQIQFSPFEYRKGILDYANDHNIAIEAYSPLGRGHHLQDATVLRIASSIGRTSAQVLLRWAIQRGTIVLPKSAHRERIAENAQIFDFQLSAAEMAELDALDETGGTDIAREQKWW